MLGKISLLDYQNRSLDLKRKAKHEVLPGIEAFYRNLATADDYNEYIAAINDYNRAADLIGLNPEPVKELPTIGGNESSYTKNDADDNEVFQHGEYDNSEKYVIENLLEDKRYQYQEYFSLTNKYFKKQYYNELKDIYEAEKARIEEQRAALKEDTEVDAEREKLAVEIEKLKKLEKKLREDKADKDKRKEVSDEITALHKQRMAIGAEQRAENKEIREKLDQKEKVVKEKLRLAQILGSKQYNEFPGEVRKLFEQYVRNQYDKHEGVIPKPIITDIVEYLERYSMETRSYEFYPTPDSVYKYGEDVALKAVQLAKLDEDNGLRMKILEPSAGSGNLADKILHYTKGNAKVHVVERNMNNRAILKLKGYEVLQGIDFLKINPNQHGGASYDRVIMNPPFDRRTNAAVEHVQHAFKFLKPNGILVAIIPMSAVSEKTPAGAAFRNYVERMGEIIPANPKAWKKLERQVGIPIGIIVLDKSKYKPIEVNVYSFDDIKVGDIFLDLALQGRGDGYWEVTEKIITEDKTLNYNTVAMKNMLTGKVQHHNFARELFPSDFASEDEYNLALLYSTMYLLNLPQNFVLKTQEEADENISRFQKRLSSQKEMVKRQSKNSGKRNDIDPAGNATDSSGDDSKVSYRRDPELKPVRLLTARDEYTRIPLDNHITERTYELLKPHQRDGVNLAIETLSKRQGFILADGTGTGKTMQQLALAEFYADSDAENKPALIITFSRRVANNAFVGDANKLGIGRQLTHLPPITQYTDLKELLPKLKKNHIYITEYSQIANYGIKLPIFDDAVEAYKELDELMKEVEKTNKIIDEAEKSGEITPEAAKRYKSAKIDELINSGKIDEFKEIIETYLKWELDQLNSFGKAFSVVIYDECHKMKNYKGSFMSEGSLRSGLLARRNVAIAGIAPKVVFASATPGDRPEALRYLKYSSLFKDDEEYMRIMEATGLKYVPPKINAAGIQTRDGYYKLREHHDIIKMMTILNNMFEDFTEDGGMIKRELELVNMSVELLPIDVPEEAKQMSYMLNAKANQATGGRNGTVMMENMRAMEVFKIPDTLKLIDREIEEGRNVVVFCSLIDTDLENIKEWGDVKRGTIENLYNALSLSYGADKIGLLIGKSIDAEEDNESDSEKRNNDKVIRDFQLGNKRIILTTIQSGATGISLDDQDIFTEEVYDQDGNLIKPRKLIKEGGDRPRSLICMTAPLSGELNTQMLGRIYRKMTKSYSRAYYLFVPELAADKWAIKIAMTKLQTLNATMAGQNTAYMTLLESQNDDYSELSAEDAYIAEQYTMMQEQKKEGKIRSLDNPLLDDLIASVYNGRHVNGMDHAAQIDVRYKLDVETNYRDNVTGIILKVSSNINKMALMTFLGANEDFFKELDLKYELISSRYEGTSALFKMPFSFSGDVQKKGFKSKIKKDKRISEALNRFLSIIFFHRSTESVSEKQLFNVDDKVVLLAPQAYYLVPPESIGTIESVRDRGLTKVIDAQGFIKVINQYLYAVDFDDKGFIPRVPQKDLALYEAAGTEQRLLEIGDLVRIINVSGNPKFGGYNDDYGIVISGLKETHGEEYPVYTVRILKNDRKLNIPPINLKRINTEMHIVSKDQASPLKKGEFVELIKDSPSDTDNYKAGTIALLLSDAEFSRYDDATILFLIGISPDRVHSSLKIDVNYLQRIELIGNDNEPDGYDDYDEVIDDDDSLLTDDTLDGLDDEGSHTANVLERPKSAKDILKTNFPQKPLKLNRTKHLFGTLLDDANIFVAGGQGDGKTSFSLIFCDDLKDNLKDGQDVIYIHAEERIGERLKNSLKRNRVNSERIKILHANDYHEILDHLKTGAYRFVILDSHNTIKGADQKQLMKMIVHDFAADNPYDNPHISFVVISRKNKEGKYKGDGDWAYELDTIVELNKGVATTSKHRDAPADQFMQVYARKQYF